MSGTNTAVNLRPIYQLKVVLLGTDPPIWRRLQVLSDNTLEHLHQVLQVAFDWEDCHLHEFRYGRQRYGTPDLDDSDVASERGTRLSSLFGDGKQMIYTYDFGDSWDHEIVLEDRLPVEPERVYPVCVAGERKAPPEDCGGLPGFYDLLAEGGRRFHPEVFSLDKVNRKLAALQRGRSRTARKR